MNGPSHSSHRDADPHVDTATHVFAESGEIAPPEAVSPETSFRPHGLALKLATSDDALPHLTGEIRDLMQLRLREVALLVTVGWTFVLLLCLSGIDGLFNASRLGLGSIIAMAAACVTFTVCGVAIRFGRGYSLLVLRSLEAVFLWGAVICAAWLRLSAVGAALSLVPLDRFQVLYASALSNIIWMTVFVIYGIFAPNTWRRLLNVSAAVVGVLLGTELILWWDKATAAPGLFLSNLVITLMAIFLGNGIALLGSFKIGAAQQEVARARKELRDLGRYRLTRRLGSGAMGEVYLAEHRLLRRPCAVKLIRSDKPDGGKLAARFAREVQATASLTHPNTVEIYDYGQADDGTFYYAMEYLPGLTLDELVERHGPLPPPRVVHLLRQVCGALREAHGIGLIHRDIKPANIIVCQRGGVHDVVKLLDFGLVRDLETGAAGGKDGRLTQEGAIAGTPDYMSPEQAEGVTSLDGRSDIYSLGGVAYYLLTGRPPFRRGSVLQILFAHMRDPVEPLSTHRSGIPPRLEGVVLACLEKDRANRPADVSTLDSVLQECPLEGSWSPREAEEWWAIHGADSDLPA